MWQNEKHLTCRSASVRDPCPRRTLPQAQVLACTAGREDFTQISCHVPWISLIIFKIIAFYRFNQELFLHLRPRCLPSHLRGTGCLLKLTTQSQRREVFQFPFTFFSIQKSIGSRALSRLLPPPLPRAGAFAGLPSIRRIIVICQIIIITIRNRLLLFPRCLINRSRPDGLWRGLRSSRRALPCSPSRQPAAGLPIRASGARYCSSPSCCPSSSSFLQ